MSAAVGIYNIIQTAIIMGGLMGGVTIIGLIVIAFKREEENRPMIPWGARMRVERAKARLEIDALNVKSLGIDNLRNKALKALEEGDDATLQAIVGETPIPAEIEKPKQARSYVDPY